MTMKFLLISAALAAMALGSCNRKAPSEATLKANADPVVARYSGKQITLSELDKTVAKELYDVRRQALERMILRPLIKAEAAQAGKEEEAYFREMVEKSASKVTEGDLRKLYEANKERLGGRSLDEVKPLLEQRAQHEKQEEAARAFVEQLKKRAKVQILLPIPRTQVAATGPSKGPASAPVTIVEFSDFECPYCSTARKTVEEAIAAYPGKIRLVFRNFPLPFHSNAQKAAEAGLCADEQGKFWALHDRMFDQQEKLAVDDLKAHAKALGLDTAKFDQCLDSGKMAAKVKESVEAAHAAGVTGTPAFFVNGRLLSGAQPLEKFKELIDEELKGK
jgi:protein-disulfide isomerase